MRQIYFISLWQAISHPSKGINWNAVVCNALHQTFLNTCSCFNLNCSNSFNSLMDGYVKKYILAIYFASWLLLIYLICNCSFNHWSRRCMRMSDVPPGNVLSAKWKRSWKRLWKRSCRQIVLWSDSENYYGRKAMSKIGFLFTAKFSII